MFKLPRRDNVPRLIFCADGSIFATLALRYNIEYGCQVPNAAPIYPIAFADQDWKDPDRPAYMNALQKHKPDMATVLDFERPEQFDEVMSWAEEAAQHVRETVIIIPKFKGSIEMLPEQVKGKKVVLGYSVPTSFGGTPLPISAFGRRPVHLLGGSPQKQMELTAYCNVVSVDANMTSKMATRQNSFFCAGFGPRGNSYFTALSTVGHTLTVGAYVLAFEMSCMNVYSAWHFPAPCFLRYAHKQDLAAIAELDHWAARAPSLTHDQLLTHIANHHVYVAQQYDTVIGYCVAPRRPSGFTQVLHISVHPGHRQKYVGSALLSLVTHTAQAVVPVGDTALNALFEARGWKVAQQTSEQRTWEQDVQYSDARRLAEIWLRAHHDKNTRYAADNAQHLLFPLSMLEKLTREDNFPSVSLFGA